MKSLDLTWTQLKFKKGCVQHLLWRHGLQALLAKFLNDPRLIAKVQFSANQNDWHIWGMMLQLREPFSFHIL